VVLDKRVDCGVKGIGASCGALIEVWPSVEAVATRVTTLQGDTTTAAKERDYTRGNVLLRVTTSLTEEQALAYQAVLDAQVSG
jgi:hypothetical protein